MAWYSKLQRKANRENIKAMKDQINPSRRFVKPQYLNIEYLSKFEFIDDDVFYVRPINNVLLLAIKKLGGELMILSPLGKAAFTDSHLDYYKDLTDILETYDERKERILREE